MIFDDVEKVNFPRLIMNQFRWLDRVVNSKVCYSGSERNLASISVKVVSIDMEVFVPNYFNHCRD